MYRNDAFDHRLVQERLAQFRDQTRRFLTGELSEDEFRPLRLQNGLYIQRHAPMFRISIPYGLLSTVQLRKLADIARRYDRGYGHFSTRPCGVPIISDGRRLDSLRTWRARPALGGAVRAPA